MVSATIDEGVVSCVGVGVVGRLQVGAPVWCVVVTGDVGVAASYCDAVDPGVGKCVLVVVFVAGDVMGGYVENPL